MASIQFNVTFPTEDLIEENFVTHTWAFTGTDAAEDLVTEARQRLDDFYSLTPTGGDAAIIDYGVDYISYANTFYKAYDIADPPPRMPAIGLLGLTQPTLINGSPYPAEVALCLSFQADMVSGQPPARRRGRVYLGPWGFAAGQSVTNSYSRPDPTGVMFDIRASATRLQAENTAACSWGVYSRVDEIVRPVVMGWVDDAWDTQRRRGPDHTVKAFWPV